MMSNWGYHWSYNQGSGATSFATSIIGLLFQLLWFAFVIGLIVALIVIIKNYLFNGKRLDLSFLNSSFLDTKTDTQNDIVSQSSIYSEPTCLGCGGEVMLGLKYCPRCGAELNDKCPTCSKEVQLDWKYCTGCGTEVLRTKEV